MKKTLLFLTFASLLLASCEQIDHSSPDTIIDKTGAVSSRDVAAMLSSLPLDSQHLQEVYDAVSASSQNGYDEEYTMEDLFLTPGAGVGDRQTKASRRSYSSPLRELIKTYIEGTKAAGEPGFGIEDLQNSGLQLYWPWYEKWDGTSYPAITFDPGDGSSSNIAYKLTKGEDGLLKVQELIVDETYASNNPVWVVNTNDDAAYTSVELLRRQAAGDDGDTADVIIGRKRAGSVKPKETTDDADQLKTLVIKEFTMLRNYDSWLTGGSEFFVKCGSLQNFTATTEAELLLYNPTITDFMIEIQRKDLGIPQTINAILVDEWTDQLERVAFMVTEDDGGTWESWKTELEVKIKSKTYGIGINLPIRSRDDIVWRGSLSYKYFAKYKDVPGRFGDVEIAFSFLGD